VAFDLFGRSKPVQPNPVTRPLSTTSPVQRPDLMEEKARLDALLNQQPRTNSAAQPEATTPMSDLLDLPRPNPAIPQQQPIQSPSKPAMGSPQTSDKKAKKPAPNRPQQNQPSVKPPELMTAPNDADLEAYNKGVELFQVAQGQAEKGNLNGQQALLQEAHKQFEVCLRLNPQRVEAQSNLGFVELTLRRYRPAVKAFERALAIQPHHPNTLNGLATTYTLMNQTDKALAVMDQLLKVVPDNPQYWYNQGCMLQKARRFDDAEKSYQQALSLYPQDQRTLFNLGTLAEARGKRVEAETLFTKAKNTGIDTPIGLEAYKRLQSLKQIPQKPVPPKPDTSWP
jgi:tetratricopeptide (TPR) repeat protein